MQSLYRYDYPYTEKDVDYLEGYGHKFSLIIPGKNRTCVAYGFFKGRKWIIQYDYGVNSKGENDTCDDGDFVDQWVMEHEKEIKKILRIYAFKQFDPHLWVYENLPDRAGRWRLVVDMWLTNTSLDNWTYDLLQKIEKYEQLAWKGEYAPALIIHPVVNDYSIKIIDVWTPTPSKFKKALNIKPRTPMVVVGHEYYCNGYQVLLK